MPGGFPALMLSGAMEVELDSMGRILVPDYLKQYAQLKRKVVVAGLYNRIEIWDSDKWNTYKEKTEKEAGDIAERLETNWACRTGLAQYCFFKPFRLGREIK